MAEPKLNKPPAIFTFSLFFLEIAVLFALYKFSEDNPWDLSNSSLVLFGMFFYPFFNKMSYMVTIILYGKQK